MTLHRAPLPVEGTCYDSVASFPPGVPRDIPDETVKALVFCLVLTTFLAVTTTTVTVTPFYLQFYVVTVVTSS